MNCVAVLFCWSFIIPSMGDDEICKLQGDSCIAPEDEVSLMQARVQMRKQFKSNAAGKAYESDQSEFWLPARIPAPTASPSSCSSRGFATCVAGKMRDSAVSDVALATAAIQQLRKLGNHDCVEVYHVQELSDAQKKTLESIPRTFVRDLVDLLSDADLHAVDGDWTKFRSFDCLIMALLHSSFDEVMLMDSDILFLRNPTQIWNHPVIQKVGTMFFYDRPVALINCVGCDKIKNCDNIEKFAARQDVMHTLSPSLREGWQDSHPGYCWNHWNEQCSTLIVVNKTHLHAAKAMAMLKMIHTEYILRDQSLTGWSYGDKEFYWIACELAGVECGFNPRGRPCEAMSTSAFLQHSSWGRGCTVQLDPSTMGLQLLYINLDSTCDWITPNIIAVVSKPNDTGSDSFRLLDTTELQKLNQSLAGFRSTALQANESLQINVTELAMYLDGCARHIPDSAVNFPTPSAYAEWMELPNTTAGKYLMCLAQHEMTQSAAILFYGYPGPNGVFSAALGLRAKYVADSDHSGFAKLVSAEADEQRCKEGKAYLKEQGVADHVDLRCEIACSSGDEQACLEEFQHVYCPRGRLDFLATDFSLATPPKIYRSVLKGCRPKMLFTENSGLEWWLWGLNESDSYSDYSEDKQDSWHHYEERLHAAAVEGQGDFRLSVDRKLSGFLGESISANPARKFSVYVSADLAPP